jgi:hypothetical protein
MRSYQLVTVIAALGFVTGALPPAFGRDTGLAASSFAQAARPPTRIRVHALGVTHPGPNSVRRCFAWIEPEYRPSGTVIVPRMHCWWAPG